MSSDDPISQGLASFFDKARNAASNLGMRLVVHLTGVICAAGAEGMNLGNAFAVYMGIVCLLPRGMSRGMDWVLPVMAGGLQAFLCLGWGAPLPLSLLLGGAQTWMQRLVVKKGSLGWEWSVLPWLCAAFAGVDFAPSLFQTVPGGFLALLALGWCANVVYARTRLVPALRRRLHTLINDLHRSLAEHPLPESLRDPVRQLVSQLQKYVELSPGLDGTSAALADSGTEVLQRIRRLGRRPVPRLWDDEAGRCFAAVTRLNETLHTRLSELDIQPGRKREVPAEGSPEAVIAEFHTSAAQLADKKYLLAPDMHPHIDGIRRNTENILTCMRDAKEDFHAGSRFLSRYLPAAHRVVDEYVRLSREGGQHQHVAAALGRSTDVLSRLEAAFLAEHGRLLRSDTISFTAELNLLDKLLKMDGQ